MSNENSKAGTNRPYPPPNSVIALLTRLRSRNMPEQIDAEYLRDAGISDSLNARTLFALRFLGLVDGTIPTATLRSLARSTDEEYQATLAGIIRDAYSEVFERVDPSQDTQDRVLNVFRRYEPASQRDRMVTFFLGMCREAGIPTVDAPRSRPTSVSGSPKPAKSKAGPRAASQGQGRSTAAPPSGARNTSSNDLAPALELLVRSLPPAGKPMSNEKREQWIALARATLAYVYPTADDELEEDQEDEQADD